MTELSVAQDRYFSTFVAHFMVVAVTMGLGFLSQLSGFDTHLASFIVESQGGTFLRDHFIFDTLLHKGGRYLIGAILVFFICMLLLTCTTFKSNRFPPSLWGYLITSSICCIVLVSLLKQVTTLPCPWNVDLYGGTRQYITVFDALKNSFPAAHCYPSGHASGGYALLSCFFAANQYRRANGQQEVRSAYYWLLPGMLLGVAFGIAQQFRGAHFVSHDLMSFSMCYAVCCLMQLSFFKR